MPCGTCLNRELRVDGVMELRLRDGDLGLCDLLVPKGTLMCKPKT